MRKRSRATKRASALSATRKINYIITRGASARIEPSEKRETLPPVPFGNLTVKFLLRASPTEFDNQKNKSRNTYTCNTRTRGEAHHAYSQRSRSRWEQVFSLRSSCSRVLSRGFFFFPRAHADRVETRALKYLASERIVRSKRE